MIDANELYRRVRVEAGLDTDEEVCPLVRKVVRALGQSLPPDGMERLRRSLPPDLAAALDRVPREQDHLMEPETFIGALVNDLDTEYLYDQSYGGLDLVSVYADDDANRRVQATLAALRPLFPPGEFDALIDQLPAGLGNWLREGGY